MMMSVSGGFSGSPEHYAVYIYPLLSHTLAYLYHLSSRLSWYPLCWFFFFYLAYSGYLEVIFCKVNYALYRLLFVIAFLCFSIHSIFYLQFTVVTGVLAFAGYLLIMSHYQGHKLSKYDLWLGGMLCLLSLMVRKESFFMFTVGFGLLFLVKFGWKNAGKILLNRKWLILAAFLLVIFTPFYEKLSGYQDYVTFNTARAKVLDHPVLSYLPLGRRAAQTYTMQKTGISEIILR